MVKQNLDKIVILITTLMNFKNFLIISILAIVFSQKQSEELNYLKLK